MPPDRRVVELASRQGYHLVRMRTFDERDRERASLANLRERPKPGPEAAPPASSSLSLSRQRGASIRDMTPHPGPSFRRMGTAEEHSPRAQAEEAFLGPKHEPSDGKGRLRILGRRSDHVNSG